VRPGPGAATGWSTCWRELLLLHRKFQLCTRCTRTVRAVPALATRAQCALGGAWGRHLATRHLGMVYSGATALVINRAVEMKPCKRDV
jgi:hypothetical protein